MIFTILFARSRICSSASSNLLWISSSIFFISIIIVLFSSNCLIFYLCWISHCIHIFFSWVQGVSLWSLLWTLYLVNSFSPFHFFFLKVLSCSFLCKASFSLHSLFNSLCLSLTLFFYVLGISGPSPSLERMTICKKWGAVTWCPMVTRGRCSKSSPFVGCMYPPVLIRLHFCGFADGCFDPFPHWPWGTVVTTLCSC